MDYFKRAASAVLSQAGGPFPGYSIGEREPYLEARTIWSLHSGTKREDGSACSILVFDSTLPPHNPRRNLLPLAKNACRKFRTLRHPDVLKFIDSFENEKAVYIAVEKVRPLGKAMEDQRNRAKGWEEWVGWGIRSVATALQFINESATSTHGNVRLDSIFLSASGEWRLGGFEVLSSAKDDAAVLYNYGGLLPDVSRFAPPEVKQGGWGPLRDLATHALDSYSFALLILEAYNGSLPPITGSSVPPAGKVPPQIYTLVKRMMVPNAKARGTAGQLLAAGEAPGGFFTENRLVKVATGLDGFVLAREEERAEIMRQLKAHSDSFPPEFTQYKVLPALVHALSLASSGQHAGSSTIQATKILPLVLHLGSGLSDAEWSNSLSAPILASYKSPDRGVRMALLENLELYSDRLEAKRIVDGVWPNLITGFSDSAAAIREATVKAILPLAPKLSDRILNNDLLRQLAKTQVDSEPGIRTNTTILLGRLSPNLSLNTRRKVLVPAFSRSLKDPFLHARMAGLMALMATGESYERDDMARLIVPAIAPCLVDQEKVVRDQAKQGVNMFLKRIEAEVASMPDTVLPQVNEDIGFGTGNSSASSDSTSPMPFAKPPEGFAATAGGAASALAGWTISAFAKQIDPSGLTATSMDNQQAPPSSASPAPSAVATSSRLSTTPAVTGKSSIQRSYSGSSFGTASSSTFAPVADEQADAASSTGWGGGDDLIDVNDDAGDWSSFEVGVKKATEVPRRTLGPQRSKPKASTTANAIGSKLGTVRPTPTAAPTARSSLAVKDTFADDDAWGEASESTSNQATPSNNGASGSKPSLTSSTASLASGASTPSATAAAAAAFAAPLPNTLETTSTATAEESWGGIDDAPNEVADDQAASAGAEAGNAVPLSKEEKRAEMERQRQERRAVSVQALRIVGKELRRDLLHVARSNGDKTQMGKNII